MSSFFPLLGRLFLPFLLLFRFHSVLCTTFIFVKESLVVPFSLPLPKLLLSSPSISNLGIVTLCCFAWLATSTTSEESEDSWVTVLRSSEMEKDSMYAGSVARAKKEVSLVN